MASTEYAVTPADWTDCGASDDCTLQIPGGVCAIRFTVAATKPDINSQVGLRLSTDRGDERVATIEEPGLKVWVRSVGNPVTVTVGRG